MTPPKQPLQRLFLFLLAVLHLTQAFAVVASVSPSSSRCSGRPSRVAAELASAGSTSLDQGKSGGGSTYRTDTLRGSTLTAGQDLSLSAGTAQAADLTVAASRLTAGNDATLAASGNVVVASMAETASLSASNWGARDNASVRKDSASAVGSVVQAGNDLAVTSTGSLVVEGSALEAGRNLQAQVGGDLQLLAAVSTRRESVQSSRLTRRQAESLAFELDQNRQLLSTITAGSGIDLQVGGNVLANVGTKDEQGALQADRMTASGVVKGTDRQQVSVGGSGSTAGVSQVLGSLAGQGIRNGANDAFAATATKEGQAAVQALLQSGLVGIKNNPALQSILAAPTPNGAAVTYKDDAGKVQLTLAGQAKVQEVYSALRLTETFDVQKFADPGMGQIVTLVAAIALTATSGGAGAAFLGAAEGTVSAAMANAAFTSMTSTMIGQMASGASLGDALAAGLRAAASSALTAGILNTPIIDGPTGLQSLNQWAGVQDVAGTGAKLARGDWSNLGQTAAGIGLRGAVNAGVNTAIYGGSFGQAFTSSVVGDAAAIGANVVGQQDWSLGTRALAHAAVGATAAKLTGRDALSGAIGGAGATLINPLLDDAIGGTDGAGWSNQAVRSGVLQLGSMAGSALIAKALGKDGMTAASAAQNETVNNYLYPKERDLKAKADRACGAGNASACQIGKFLSDTDARREATPSAKFQQGFLNALVQAGGGALLLPVEITQAIAEGRSLEALANALSGIAGLPSRLATGLTSNDPATQGAAVAESLMLVGGAAALAKSVVKTGATGSTSTAATIENNFYRDGGIADPSKAMSATGPWRPAATITASEANSMVTNALPSSMKVTGVQSGDALNVRMAAGGDAPPYLPGAQVYDVAVTESTQMVRVYGVTNSQTGGWMMKATDIQGLTPQQIASKYGLPEVPTMVTDVNLPVGTQLQASVANGISPNLVKTGTTTGGNGGGGGVQFQLSGKIDPNVFDSMFSNPRPLQ